MLRARKKDTLTHNYGDTVICLRIILQFFTILLNQSSNIGCANAHPLHLAPTPLCCKTFFTQKENEIFFNVMEQKYIIGSICILKILSSKAMHLFHVTQLRVHLCTLIPRMKTCILDVANHMDLIEKWQLKPSKKYATIITKVLWN